MSDVRHMAIVGSRTYPCPADVFATIEDEGDRAEILKFGRAVVEEFVAHFSPVTTVLVSGGAVGVDTWAADKAREMGMRVVEIKPNYKKYGKAATWHRNGEIADAADDVVAFWDDVSRGTLDTVNKAIKRRKPLALFGPAGEVVLSVTEETYAANPPKMVVPRSRNAR